MDREQDKKPAETVTDGYDPRQYRAGEMPEAAPADGGEDYGRPAPKYGIHGWTLTALTPFIYVALGLLLKNKFDWWAWGWIIIPVSAILGTRIAFWQKFIALSPFIYILLGFFFGWWAWAWLIIPVSAIVSTGMYRRS
jgi:HAMP domain-containing protein